MRLDPGEQWVLDHAGYFVACAFRGRGKYERIETPDLDSARVVARRLVCDRPVAIYAVVGRGLAAPQACVELIGQR